MIRPKTLAEIFVQEADLRENARRSSDGARHRGAEGGAESKPYPACIPVAYATETSLEHRWLDHFRVRRDPARSFVVPLYSAEMVRDLQNAICRLERQAKIEHACFEWLIRDLLRRIPDKEAVWVTGGVCIDTSKPRRRRHKKR